jgi:hypothetical protein
VVIQGKQRTGTERREMIEETYSSQPEWRGPVKNWVPWGRTGRGRAELLLFFSRRPERRNRGGRAWGSRRRNGGRSILGRQDPSVRPGIFTPPPPPLFHLPCLLSGARTATPRPRRLRLEDQRRMTQGSPAAIRSFAS